MSDQVLTATQLQHRLEITAMTLHLWRKGDSERPALPFIVKEGGRGRFRRSILFPESLVEAWLRLYRPDYVDNFRTNHCDCKRCAKLGRKDPLPQRATDGSPINAVA